MSTRQKLCYDRIPPYQLHQPWLWFITGGYLVKRWFLPAAARARGQSNDLNREILASNLFNCCKEVINAPPVPSISRCIHIVYRHKNVSEYQWSNFIYNCMSTFLHYVHCKDALLDCSAPGGERCESLTRVDEIPNDNTSQNNPFRSFKTKLSIIVLCKKRFSWNALGNPVCKCWHSNVLDHLNSFLNYVIQYICEIRNLYCLWYKHQVHGDYMQ